MGTSDGTLNGANHAFVRYTMQFFIMAILIRLKKLDFFGPKKYFMLMWFRGVVGFVSVILKQFAIKYIRPSDIAVLKDSHVIITTLFGSLFLNEAITMSHCIAIVLTLTGIVCVSRPEAIFESRYVSRYFGHMMLE